MHLPQARGVRVVGQRLGVPDGTLPDVIGRYEGAEGARGLVGVLEVGEEGRVAELYVRVFVKGRERDRKSERVAERKRKRNRENRERA